MPLIKARCRINPRHITAVRRKWKITGMSCPKIRKNSCIYLERPTHTYAYCSTGVVAMNNICVRYSCGQHCRLLRDPSLASHETYGLQEVNVSAATLWVYKRAKCAVKSQSQQQRGKLVRDPPKIRLALNDPLPSFDPAFALHSVARVGFETHCSLGGNLRASTDSMKKKKRFQFKRCVAVDEAKARPLRRNTATQLCFCPERTGLSRKDICGNPDTKRSASGCTGLDSSPSTREC